MKAIELIRWAMQMTTESTNAILEGLHDKPLTQPSPGLGNHPLWLIGHLCFTEGAIPQMLLGEENPVAHWAPLFGTGTTPSTDASKYPPFEEVLQTFHKLRAQNLRLLDQIGDAGLDRPAKWVPPGFEDVMKSAGHILLLFQLHNMVHYGQIADARRVAGLKPLM